MMQLTEEQRKALIEYCESRISELAPYAKQRKVMEIALAALTAKPAAWRWEKNNGLYFEGIKPIGIDSQPLYTVPPVAVLRPVKRPATKCIGWVRDAIHEHDAKGIEAIREAGYEVSATTPVEGKE